MTRTPCLPAVTLPRLWFTYLCFFPPIRLLPWSTSQAPALYLLDTQQTLNEGKKLYRLMPSLANGHQVDHLEQFFFLIC